MFVGTGAAWANEMYPPQMLLFKKFANVVCLLDVYVLRVNNNKRSKMTTFFVHMQ
jgi:hypothetical protein